MPGDSPLDTPAKSALGRIVRHSPASNLAGVSWGVLAVGIFAFIYLAGKLTGSEASALQIMWLRYVGGLATVVVLMAVTRTRLEQLATMQAPVHALRAAMGAAGGSSGVYAATHMPVVSASAIGLLDGAFTVALGVLLLKERVSGRQYAAAALCLFGAAMVVLSKGALDGFDRSTLVPATVALAGALFVAIESLLIKRLARSERLIPVLFYVNLFGALIMTAPGWLSWSDAAPSHLALFLALGPLAISGQACNILAFRLSDVAVLGPVRYSWIVFGLAFGWFFFGESITVIGLAGTALVLAGGLWLALARVAEAPASTTAPQRDPGPASSRVSKD